VICMKLTVVQLRSNNGSRELVRSSNHSVRCHLRSSCFPPKNLNVVSSKISTSGSPSPAAGDATRAGYLASLGHEEVDARPWVGRLSVV